MTDTPYRDAELACPTCGTAMRSYQGRLVCDGCTGMLITVTDLQKSVVELGETATIVAAPEEGVSTPCPRCRRQMTASHIMISETRINPAMATCAADGVWFPGGQLAGLFVVINRKTHFGRGQGRTYGGASSGGGAGGLRISQWEPKRKPRDPSTLFHSAFSGQTLTCPTCKDVLHFHTDHWSCDLCHGVFVETAALETMVKEMTGQPWTLPAEAGAAGERKCPVCTAAMTTATLEHVDADRCIAHGVWFEPARLAEMLEHAADHPTKPRGWLHRFFSR